MASLIPTDPELLREIDEAFENLQVELVHCELCGDYHPPELHLPRATLFEEEEPADA